MNLIKLWDGIVSIVFPSRCIICDELLPRSSKTHLCTKCAQSVTFISDITDTCKKCSRPIDKTKILCDICQVANHYYSVARSCLIYEGKIRYSLLRYKFYNKKYLCSAFAEIMAERIFAEYDVSEFDMLLAVPSSATRIKKRGFNHTAVIAARISRLIGTPFFKSGIAKIKDTPPQSKLSYAERFRSVKGAFKLNTDLDFKNKHILLIDDIYTTGATADEISKLLKRRGADCITVFTLCITSPEGNILKNGGASAHDVN